MKKKGDAIFYVKFNGSESLGTACYTYCIIKPLLLCIVLYEFAVLFGLLVIGTMYILSSQGIGNIVQAVVALAFINDIDLYCHYITFYSISVVTIEYSVKLSEWSNLLDFLYYAFAIYPFIGAVVLAVTKLSKKYCD